MKSTKIEAIQIGETIFIKKFLEKYKYEGIAKDPTIIKWSATSYAVLFRYGVIVLWNFTDKQKKTFLRKINTFITKPLDTLLTEEAAWSKGQKMKISDGLINTATIDNSKRQLIAVSLARTVILDYFEHKVDALLIKFSTIIEQFNNEGRSSFSSKKLLRLEGSAMVINNQTVSQITMLDKPDFIWDDPELDTLFMELEEEYEISERYEILNKKLETLLHDSEFIMNFLEARRANFLELIIVVLFVIDIALILMEYLN